MSYVTPQYAPPSGQPEKPSTVTIASLSLIGMALLSLVGIILSIISSSKLDAAAIKDIYRAAGADASIAETSANLVVITVYVGIGLSVVLAALYLILGLSVGKGKQWARITSWVIAGLAICCNGLGAAGGALSGSLTGNSGAAGFDTQQVQDKIAGLSPSWLASASLALSVIQLLLAITVVVTLALPPSNGYFRRPEPEWVPPAGPVV